MARRDKSFLAWVCGMRSGQIYRIFVFTLLSWAVASLYFYSTFDLDLSFDSLYFETFGFPLSPEVLKKLMSRGDPGSAPNPLSRIIRYEDKMLQFYHLPIRMLGAQYTELTSANRDTSYPLAPDFTFHIRYSHDHVVLYEDRGPGCVYRIYILPAMPTETTLLHKLTSRDLTDSTLTFQVDGREFKFSLYHLLEGDEWPFFYPISAQRPRPSVGIGMYTPICYQESLTISYHPTEALPPNLLQSMANCSRRDLFCPIHIYSAISRHKFPAGTKVDSFALAATSEGRHDNQVLMQGAAELLHHPEKHGPDRHERCVLECVVLCTRCRKVLFMSKRPEVISAMRFRVFDAFSGSVVSDWSNVLLTIHLDGAPVPQLERIPLGALFGASASLNDFMGAALGRRRQFCTYDDGVSALPSTTSTGYIYFPMPYWKEATIYIDASSALDKNVLVCMQISTVENFYSEEETGYFHALNTHYMDNVSGWRNVLTLHNTWGHVVGLMMEVENLRAVRNVPLNERWATLQADSDIFIDGQKSASVLGTGLEDYFSYAHGFALAENTSYSFVGVQHTAPKRKEPLSWHCYRLHVLDPIPFQKSIQFIMEGTGMGFQEPVRNTSFDEYMTRRELLKTTLSHLVLYYAKPGSESSLAVTDTLQMAGATDDVEHGFAILHQSSETAGGTFHVKDTRYLGACNVDETFQETGKAFAAGDKFRFTLKILPVNRGVILRRTFHSIPMKWNEVAQIWVNGIDYGDWVIPMGALVDEYSLRQEDFLINRKDTQALEKIVIEIGPQSTWRDIRYTALTIV